ncbi:class III lanthionine synthetase LanKC [Glycomyces tritici]|uniref:Class III lanthionine synthetase LanKC n=1 Tax=Glycomyces tritici TaxID=2665176 RepID=A0ABT7YX04_9ACTN|nr:class III lanthionine synthetase LanKC [Glycomyces tritici]MDN3243174.1 class III lanthionine synthetase LanKC [Glycomyces tritici]
MTLFDAKLLQLYTSSSKLWFTDPSLQPVSPKYLEIVRSHVGPSARFDQSGNWTMVDQGTGEGVEQGWKIHVSALNSNAEAVLDRTVAALAELKVDFKFLSDEARLADSNSRLMPRGNGCKFITVYPVSELQCGHLLGILYEALRDFKGPRILSDRRYRDCAVLYYRFGGHRPLWQMTTTGAPMAMIRNPENGELVPDMRLPHWSPPEWIRYDPFAAEEPAAVQGIVLADRYRVESALRFTNIGGIYLGTDLETGRQIVAKEARPGTDTLPDRDMDAVSIRRNEYSMLSRLKGSNGIVEPIDYFVQDEHAFLIIEFLDESVHLLSFITGRHPLLTLDGADAYEDYFRTAVHVWIEVATTIARLHDARVVHGDLSLLNIMLDWRTGDDLPHVTLIDFESAVCLDEHETSYLISTGFTPMNQRQDRLPKFANDVFALGTLMLACLFPSTEPGIADRRQFHRLIGNLNADLPLPEGLAELVTAMTDEDPLRRPPIEAVVARLKQLKPKAPEAVGPAGRLEAEASKLDLMRLVSGIGFASTLDRSDRAYAGDPMLYSTNPLSVAYGVVGVMRALAYMGQTDLSGPRSWLLQRRIHADDLPPGLYLGMSGIAWACDELGMREYAHDVMALANGHSLIGESSTVFDGDAGVVFANLHFWHRSGDTTYLETAARLAERVRQALESSQFDRPGFAFGASGSALALLYAGTATGDDKLELAGLNLIREVMSHARAMDAGYRSIPETLDVKYRETVSPYWLSGSAGVGGAALRFWLRFQEEDLQRFVDDLVVDASRKYTMMPGYLSGLSGMGDFLLDVHSFTGKDEALRGACRVAEGIAIFAREEDGHLLFPGSQLLRHSADFATGAAGIGMFLHRLEGVRAGGDPGPVQLLPDHLPQRAKPRPTPGERL